MSEAAKEARRKMQEKAKRLTTASNEKVDASDFDGYPDLEANMATGVRPLSRRQFRKGGKVVAKVEGVNAKHHMGRKPRKGGGSTLTPDSLINRDVREANEKRDGIKHDGGFKRGGRAKRDSGGPVNDDMGSKNSGISGSGWDDKPSRNAPPIPTSRNAPPIPKGGYNDPYEKMPPKLTAQQQSDMGRKRGGRTQRSVGGALEDAFVPGALLSDIIGGHVGKGYKRGGSAFEGTAKDKREDRVLAKKHHETFADWEHSAADKKHDKQRSMKGLKSGGKAESVSDGVAEGTRPTGGREAHKGGGRTARASGGRTKGKTNINIIIDAQPKPQGMQPPIGAAPVGPNGLAGPGAGGAMPIPVSAPAPMGGGAPPMPPQMPPQGAPMPRKSGGRTGYELEDGAGGGEGRLQKLRWYGRK